MTPPFGFSLFYLRSVAPPADPQPAIGERPRGVSTADIYLGALPFVAVQLVVMALVIAFPSLVLPDPQGEHRLSPVAVEAALRRLDPLADAPPVADPVLRLLESLQRALSVHRRAGFSA